MKRGLTWLTVQSVALATIGLYYARTARAEDQGSIRPVRAKQYLAAWRQPRLAHPFGHRLIIITPGTVTEYENDCIPRFLLQGPNLANSIGTVGKHRDSPADLRRRPTCGPDTCGT
jgi:hypothetical protein